MFDFSRRRMAQATVAATSVPDEDPSESRMVITFLVSALESMVSGCHSSLGTCSATAIPCLPPESWSMLFCLYLNACSVCLRKYMLAAVLFALWCC